MKSRAGPQLGIHQASKSKQSGRGLRNCAHKTVPNGSHSPASLHQVSCGSCAPGLGGFLRRSHEAMRLQKWQWHTRGAARRKRSEASHHSAGSLFLRLLRRWAQRHWLRAASGASSGARDQQALSRTSARNEVPSLKGSMRLTQRGALGPASPRMACRERLKPRNQP